LSIIFNKKTPGQGGREPKRVSYCGLFLSATAWKRAGELGCASLVGGPEIPATSGWAKKIAGYGSLNSFFSLHFPHI